MLLWEGWQTSTRRTRWDGERFRVVAGRVTSSSLTARYYLVLEYGECFSRRALRLYEPPDVAGYFETCVWPEHLKYRAQVLRYPLSYIALCTVTVLWWEILVVSDLCSPITMFDIAWQPLYIFFSYTDRAWPARHDPRGRWLRPILRSDGRLEERRSEGDRELNEI